MSNEAIRKILNGEKCEYQLKEDNNDYKKYENNQGIKLYYPYKNEIICIYIFKKIYNENLIQKNEKILPIYDGLTKEEKECAKQINKEHLKELEEICKQYNVDINNIILTLRYE